MSYITIDHLSLSYGENKVLKDISLTIEKGELITLLGPSGCGKSTLLRVFAGLETFQEGAVYLDGEEISETAPKDRQVGMVSQSYALFPNMSVYENIAFGLAIKKLTKSEIKEKVMSALHLVNLEDKADYYPDQLSGGQQRVSLARSLVTEPKVLLLDEPLSALDAKIRKQLQMDIRALQKQLGITMIFVTHDQEEAMILSDRVFVMSEGKVVQQETPAKLYAQPKSHFVASFIGNYNIVSIEQLQSLDPTFSPKPGKDKYAIRSETIKFEPVSSGEEVLRFNCQLQHSIVLGSTIRCYYNVGSVQLTVDLLNSEINRSELERETELYIHRDHIVAIDG